MKKIVILTTFYEATSGYSLISVVETQIKMLLDHGYDVVVLVEEGFDFVNLWQKEQIDIRKVVPSRDDDNFVVKFRQVLDEHLKGMDVCLVHDIIDLAYNSKHDVILREYAETRKHLLWLHWIHSRPTRNYEPPPGYIIYPNATDVDNVKERYNTEAVIVNRASHAIDPLDIWPYDQLTKNLVEKADLLSGDVNVIYPRGADPGKQTDKVIRLLAGVKKRGYGVRLLVVDWQSQGDKFQSYMDSLNRLCDELGLIEEVKFSSRLEDSCDQGIPRKIVTELLHLTNVYIHSSAAETYGLVPHEAILSGNLVCLNWDWPPMIELFGDNVLYFDFGSVVSDRKYWEHKPDGTKIKNEQIFWDDEAGRLMSELKGNKAVWAKTMAQRYWTPQAMWEDFESLLFLPIQ